MRGFSLSFSPPPPPLLISLSPHPSFVYGVVCAYPSRYFTNNRMCADLHGSDGGADESKAAPISFLWINPMGFVLLEFGTRNAGMVHSRAPAPPPSGCGMAWTIFKGVVSNPIVFMTFLGLIFNFVFKAAPPTVMYETSNRPTFVPKIPPRGHCLRGAPQHPPRLNAFPFTAVDRHRPTPFQCALHSFVFGADCCDMRNP